MKNNLDIEASMTELDNLIIQLEDNTLALDKAFELFERAVGLSKALQKALDGYERRIQVLTQDEGKKTFAYKNINLRQHPKKIKGSFLIVEID